MASACISLFYMRLGSPAAPLDIPKEAAFSPSCRSSGSLSALSWAVTNPKQPLLTARRMLRRPSFSFNPSEHKPFTVEELEAKIAEGNYKTSSESDHQAGSLGYDSPTQGQASEYKPFAMEEIEQKVIQRNVYKNQRQKHKTVTTIFQPLGPDYPPITLEELEADLAKSNYKPFSSFEGKGDLSGGKPFGSEYKPFTVEELEQKVGESNFKPLSEGDGSSRAVFSPPADRQSSTSVESDFGRGIGDHSYGSGLGHQNNPDSLDVESVKAASGGDSVEGFSQAASDSSSAGNEGESDLPSIEPLSFSSLEETGNSLDSDSQKATLPKITGLYVGNLPWNYTNQQLDELFKQHGSVFVSEIILDKATGKSRGFGFVYMSSPEDAEVALRNLDGKEVEGRSLRVRYQETPEEKAERLSRGGGYGKDARNVNKMFVANLPWSINDDTFGQIFSEYGTVVEARIVYDRDTGRSKGYGFITLSSADEVNSALAALNGSIYDGRALKVALAGEKPASRSSII